MTTLMRQILKSKQEGRRRLAELPISAKVAKLEKLRDRHHLIVSSPLRMVAPSARRG